jgi:HEAT repeat protein
MMLHRSLIPLNALGLAAVAFFAANRPAFAAETTAGDAPKERQFIAVLQSGAAPAEKAMACRHLAIHGTREAVPALAPLLENAELAAWARIALEAIPDPAADAALREAIGRLQGRLLVGVINSLGLRRDAQAVPALIPKLKDADAEVASAAAVALGRIGAEAAATALQARLADAPPAMRAALGEGCVRAADHLRAAGKTAAALALYDAVRAAQLPPQQRLEATRGAILAREAGGLPLLLEQLRAEDKGAFALGLRVARELPGENVTLGLIRTLESLPAARQPLLLLALADRHDPAVRPAVMQAARAEAPALRLAAVQVLADVGDAASVLVLLEAAVATDRELARAARQSLQRLHAEGVDAALTERLGRATGAERVVLMELCGQRRIKAALPALLGAVQDPQPEIRRAGLQAVGALGGENEAAELTRLVQREADPARRDELEGALLDVVSRVGARGVPQLSPLVRHAEPAVRVIGIHALASVGGTEALAAVVAATRDASESVQDEAVRALSTWPNNWPDDVAVAEPLLALVKSGAKRSHQVLGFRGYLQYLQADKRLQDSARVERIKELLPAAQWPEEKQAAIGVLGAQRTAASLELLQTLAADTAVAEEALSAQVSLAARDLPGVAKDQRRAVLQAVAGKTRNEATRKRAEEALKAIK